MLISASHRNNLLLNSPTREIDKSQEKFAIAGRARQTRETRALPGLRCAARYYFLTTSAFSIIAMPPRSASLPFKVTFFPHKSAS